jgi:magnesium-transporting ATPase (P-type)
MKKVTRTIANAIKIFKSTTDQPDLVDRREGLESGAEARIDAFYQRMFDRDIYLHISEISVAMIGVCLTGVSILNVDQDLNDVNTSVDDLLAIDSFVFLIAYLLAYWVVRVMTTGNRDMRRVGNIANIIFLIGMVVIAVVCMLIVLQGDYAVDVLSVN